MGAYVLVQHDSFHVPGVWKNLYVDCAQTSPVLISRNNARIHQRGDPANVLDRLADQQNGRDLTRHTGILF